MELSPDGEEQSVNIDPALRQRFLDAIGNKRTLILSCPDSECQQKTGEGSKVAIEFPSDEVEDILKTFSSPKEIKFSCPVCGQEAAGRLLYKQDVPLNITHSSCNRKFPLEISLRPNGNFFLRLLQSEEDVKDVYPEGKVDHKSCSERISFLKIYDFVVSTAGSFGVISGLDRQQCICGKPVCLPVTDTRNKLRIAATHVEDPSCDKTIFYIFNPETKKFHPAVLPQPLPADHALQPASPKGPPPLQEAREELWRKRYDYVGDFHDGAARVEKCGEWFHIGKDGKPLYAERYGYVEDFHDGAARVSKGGKQFHIGKDGQPLYAERYDSVEDFHDGVAIVKKGGEWFHIGKDGQPLYAERYDYVEIFHDGAAVVKKGGEWFHIEKDGQPLCAVLPPPLPADHALQPAPPKGPQPLETEDIFTLQPKGPSPLPADHALQPAPPEGPPPLQEAREELWRKRYDYVGDFHDGAAVVKKDREWFHIGKDGKPLYAERYDGVGAFQDGAAVVQKGREWFHIGKDGKPLYAERYDYVLWDFHDGVAVVRKGIEYFHIGKDGKPLSTVLPPPLPADHALQPAPPKGPQPLETEDISTFLQPKGPQPLPADHALQPAPPKGPPPLQAAKEELWRERYDYVGDFHDGVAIVRKGREQFHIGKDGKPLYAERYDGVGDFHDGVAIVKKGGEWFHIGKDGQPLYAERYDYVEIFHDGAAVVKKGREWFHIGKDGQPLYAERYDYVWDFHDGVAIVKKDGEQFHIGKDGKPQQQSSLQPVSPLSGHGAAPKQYDPDKIGSSGRHERGVQSVLHHQESPRHGLRKLTSAAAIVTFIASLVVWALVKMGDKTPSGEKSAGKDKDVPAEKIPVEDAGMQEVAKQAEPPAEPATPAKNHHAHYCKIEKRGEDWRITGCVPARGEHAGDTDRAFLDPESIQLSETAVQANFIVPCRENPQQTCESGEVHFSQADVRGKLVQIIVGEHTNN